MTTICDVIADVLDDFTATHAICSAFGTTFTQGTNLFINIEPKVSVDSLTIITYGGGPPENDGYRQYPSVQLRVNTDSYRTGEITTQACIDTFHMHGLGGAGFMTANQSSSIILGRPESGKKVVTTSNYNIKYIKQ